jgi:excisionase family DNA binding protein
MALCLVAIAANMLSQMETNATELLPVQAVARAIGQHPNTIRRAIREGRMAAVRLGPGGQLRVPRASLAEYLQPVKGE